MSRLTFAELRAANVARCNRWHSIDSWSMSDWACAMAGEAGETCNVVKKLNRERDGIIGNSVTADALREQLALEIGDTLVYLDLLAARAGIDLAEAVVATFNRVSIKHGFPERLPASQEGDQS